MISKTSRVTAIVQARMGSKRFPGKVLELITPTQTVLGFLCENLKHSEYIDDIIVATTTNKEDDEIEKFCAATNNSIICYRGSEQNVLLRAWEASDIILDTDIIVEITADCPLIPASLIDTMIHKLMHYKNCDYISNIIKREFPDGFDVQVYTKQAFDRLMEFKGCIIDHVGYNFIRHDIVFNKLNVSAPKGCCHPDWELTVDYPEDLKLLRVLVEIATEIRPQHKLGVYDYIEIIKNNPFLSEGIEKNKNLPRHVASNNMAANIFEEKK